MTLRVGLGLVTGQVPPDDIRSVADDYDDVLALARTAEAVGFDSLWVSEHHCAADNYLPSLTVMLAAIAAVTRRLTLGTAVVLAPFQHPLRFAEDCAVLDQLSRGRLIVGLGAGWRKEEFRAFGIPLAERVGRTSELARICRAAWDHETFSFHGRYFAYDHVRVTPKPFGRLPLMLGGTAPAAIERAGRLADGYMGTPMNRIEEFRRAVGIFDDAARAAGRDPHALSLGYHVNTWVSPDGGIPASVQRAMWHQIATYQVWHTEDETGQPPSEFPPINEDAIRVRTVAGTPADVIQQIRPWVQEFGARELHVIVRLHYPGMRAEEAERAVRLFAAEVIPPLRRLGGLEAREAPGRV